MEEGKDVVIDQAKIDKVIADREKIDKLTAATEDARLQADQELRRSLELRAAFYEKLAAIAAGSIAVAVSVGVALLDKASPHSPSLHSNLSWLVAITFFLWVSLLCAIGHNALFVKIGRLDAVRAKERAKWVGLLNASLMQSITGTGYSKAAQMLDKHINDTYHDRVMRGAMNQHLTEQSDLRAVVLGGAAVGSFLFAYTLVFACLIRIWWIAS